MTTSPGEFSMLLAIWIALAGWAVGAALFWTARHDKARDAYARSAWTVGALALAAHVVLAMHFVHAWQPEAAWEETARQTSATFGVDWGGGVYLNYLMTIAWLADAAWWWRGIEAYRRRSPRVTAAWHAFMMFMFFNATVVFGHGILRWLGLVLCILLGWLWWRAAGYRDTT